MKQANLSNAPGRFTPDYTNQTSSASDQVSSSTSANFLKACTEDDLSRITRLIKELVDKSKNECTCKCIHTYHTCPPCYQPHYPCQLQHYPNQPFYNPTYPWYTYTYSQQTTGGLTGITQ